MIRATRYYHHTLKLFFPVFKNVDFLKIKKNFRSTASKSSEYY